MLGPWAELGSGLIGGNGSSSDFGEHTDRAGHFQVLAGRPTISLAAQVETLPSPLAATYHLTSGVSTTYVSHWCWQKPPSLSPLLQVIPYTAPSGREILPIRKSWLLLRRLGSPLASALSCNLGLVCRALLTPAFYFLFSFPRSRPPLSQNHCASTIPDLLLSRALRVPSHCSTLFVLSPLSAILLPFPTFLS